MTEKIRVRKVSSGEEFTAEVRMILMRKYYTIKKGKNKVKEINQETFAREFQEIL